MTCDTFKMTADRRSARGGLRETSCCCVADVSESGLVEGRAAPGTARSRAGNTRAQPYCRPAVPAASGLERARQATGRTGKLCQG